MLGGRDETAGDGAEEMAEEEEADADDKLEAEEVAVDVLLAGVPWGAAVPFSVAAALGAGGSICPEPHPGPDPGPGPDPRPAISTAISARE